MFISEVLKSQTYNFFYFRREQWPLFSTYSCWQQLVTQTKNLSKDHAALSEVYSIHLVSRLAEVMEDVQRIYRRVGIL
jgi:SLIT-ROBO Rho GTPase activating protein